MAFDPKSIRDIAKSVGEAADELREKAEDLRHTANADDLTASYRRLVEERTKLDGLLARLADQFSDAGAGQTSASIANFLTEVGSAAVAAQKELDQHNLEALRSNGPEAFSQGIFRIPKLQGDIKFALGKTGTEKLGLIFYSKGSKEDSRNEQSLSFEIVSVPPPPELLQMAREQQTRLAALAEEKGVSAVAAGKQSPISLVLAPTEREAVFNALDRVDTLFGKGRSRHPSTTLIAHLKTLNANRNAVVILPGSIVPGEPPTSYLLLAADDQSPKEWRVGVWSLQLNPPELRVLWRLEAKNDDDEDVGKFKEWVQAVGKKQDDLLRSP